MCLPVEVSNSHGDSQQKSCQVAESYGVCQPQPLWQAVYVSTRAGTQVVDIGDADRAKHLGLCVSILLGCVEDSVGERLQSQGPKVADNGLVGSLSF